MRNPRSSAGRGSVALVSIVGAGLLVAFLGVLGVRLRGTQRRDQAIAELTQARMAVHPSDLRRAPSTKPEPSPWLARVAASPAPWSPLPYSGALARARRDELGAPVREMFERFESCAARANVDREALIAGVADVASARDGIVDPLPCAREASTLLAARHTEALALLIAARELGPLDPTRVVAALSKERGGVPTLPAVQLVAVMRGLPEVVLEALWNERPSQAIEALRAGLDATTIVEGAPLLVGYAAWQTQVETWLDALEIALSRLPHGTDLKWAEEEVARLEPRSYLARAVEGERTFGNRIYDLVRAGEVSTIGLPIAMSWRARFMVDADQAEYLDAVKARLTRISKRSFERRALPPEAEPHGLLAPLAQLLAPRGIGPEQADHVEARLLLARAALVAFRGGAKDALTVLQQSVDPYDGKNLRCAIGKDGLVVFWSVGPDMHDDGGSDETRDLVWRIRLP